LISCLRFSSLSAGVDGGMVLILILLMIVHLHWRHSYSDA
jgi:hypothetical protein